MRGLAWSGSAAHRRRGQRGQTSIIISFVILFVILLLGLVIDSVRLYILSVQAERAAEAGALYMPTYFSTVSPDGQDAMMRACAIIKQNGNTNCPAPPGQIGVAISIVTGNQYELQVTVTLQADIFFLAYVDPNLASATVSRVALAEYLPPIQLGSRSASFGDAVDDDANQSFWARINGPWELKENGDAYTPLWEEGPTDPIAYPDGGSWAINRWTPAVCCTNHQQWPTPITNPDQHPPNFTGASGTLGYNYAIVVPPGAGNVKVQIFNPAFDPSFSKNDGFSPPPAGTQLWGWNDMCVYFKTSGANSIFDLGEIPAAYAGKTLDFSLFDPGDSSGNVYMKILDPSGNPVQLPSWVRTVGSSGGTELDASGRYYNGLWLHMPIAIPATYNPPAGQDWWQIEYLTPNGQPTDTITINISLNGSPIHLISEVP